MTSTISCLHATARVKMAIQCLDEWRSKSRRWDDVEWIFAVDESDTETIKGIAEYLFLGYHDNVSMVINRGHQTCVAALNKAARVSMGDILMDVCDDVGCPDGWDEIVRETIPDPNKEVFVRFGDGQHSELCTHPVISRKRYEMLGYFMHPDFDCTCKFADEDATLRAKKDGVTVERLDVIFEHRHPAFGKNEWDDVYLRARGNGNGPEILWKHHPEKRPK